MRKLFAALALVFAFAFALGVFAPASEAAGNCTTTCICGTAMRCCEDSSGNVACKPAGGDWNCPQVQDC